MTLYGLDTTGKPPVRLASYPSEGSPYLTFSRDGHRALRVETRPRGDVWLMRNFDGQAPQD